MSSALAEHFVTGLEAPICLTWEVTYACNLACIHCLSSSGRRRPDELTTREAHRLIDEWADLRVFYVNIGGGEPLLRPDMLGLVEYANARGIGVKIATNGAALTPAKAQRLASLPDIDVQVSLDGATARVNDSVRGAGSYRAARRAMGRLQRAGFEGFKISVVLTRANISELDRFEAIAEFYGAALRITRLRPAGRGADVWHELHPTADQQRLIYDWLIDRPHVLTGDSMFHLGAFGRAIPGMNLCGAGRIVCAVDPVGDVYACPFAMTAEFKAGNVREPGGFTEIWKHSPVLGDLRVPETPTGACGTCKAWETCAGGCFAAKHFAGVDLTGPDPECVLGNGSVPLPHPRTTSVAAPR